MPKIAQMPAKALLPEVGADPRSSCRNPAGHTKSPCAAENEATVALPKATTRVDLLRGSRLEERSSRYSAITPNVWAKAKLIWKQLTITYISATLLYLVSKPNDSSATLGKNILCSTCWA